MIDPDKLEAGVPYFMLGFHDRDAKIPQVYTYIFVGRCPDKLDPKLPEKLCFRTGDSLPEMLSYQQIVEEVKKDGHEKAILSAASATCN